MAEQSAPGTEWDTGPHALWRTAEREPWPDWPADQWLGQRAGPEQPDEQWQDEPREASGEQWQRYAAAAEPSGEQWSAQLRRQASAAEQPIDEPVRESDERWAMISYLGVPFLAFLAPLAVYLIKLRTSPFARRHACQALNLSITVLLYNFCALIIGALLALDTVDAALVIMVPILAVLWLITLGYLVVAGTAASRGDYFRIPRWLCATLVR